MRFTLYLKDYETERIFTFLRWIFLFIACVLFYYPPLDAILKFEHRSFPALLIMGILYMAIAQAVFMRMDSNHKYFSLLIKCGIVFDFIALMWLIVLTHGVESILFPVSFLLVMHATIYWKTKGSFISSAFATLGYAVIFFFEQQHTEDMWVIFLMNITFIWIIGLFGAMIVLRERKHIKMKEIYHELVVTDYLTGLYNHRHFQEQLRMLSDKESSFFLIMGDIDNFKPINDQYGHLVGDEVLRCLGKIFNDTADKYGGLAFRYGGEEFAFLIPYSPQVDIHAFVTEIYQHINERPFTEKGWTSTISFGVSIFNGSKTTDILLASADSLLYKAKNEGKNRACFEDGFTLENKIVQVIQPVYA